MNEKIDYLKSAGALFFPRSHARAVELANAAFQQMKASILPESLTDFYYLHSGAVLGDACVFPIEDADRPDGNYVMPSIVKINRDLAGFSTLRGKTIWGRNQLYWFSADVAGILYMHDVLTLMVLRKYNDVAAAIADCLLVGKI
jgi:hypothetical protein